GQIKRVTWSGILSRSGDTSRAHPRGRSRPSGPALKAFLYLLPGMSGGGGGGGGGSVAFPVTTAVPAPPSQVKVTLVPYPPPETGLNRTAIVWLLPGLRTNELPVTTPNGSLLEALPP